VLTGATMAISAAQHSLSRICVALFLNVYFLISAASGQSVLESIYEEKLDKETRVSIQYHLMWAGKYNATLDGDIGTKTINAIKDFQSELGMVPTGVVSTEFMDQLRQVSELAKQKSGFSVLFDEQSGADIGIPYSYVGAGTSTGRGTKWRHSDKGKLEIETVRIAEFGKSLDSIFESLKAKHGKSTTYTSKKDKWFVISGEKNSKKFYARFHEDLGDIRGFSVSYDAGYANVVDRIVVAMANSYNPWAISPVVPKAPELTMPVQPGVSGGQTEQNPEIAAVTPSDSQRPTPPIEPNAEPQPAASANTQEASAPSTTVSPPKPPEPQEPLLASTGTGFAVSAAWLLTNAHVVEGCTKVNAKAMGSASRIILDSVNDLALLEFPANSFSSPLPFSGKRLELGESVVAFGYPLRQLLSDTLNLTVGNVSSMAGLQNDSRYLQMTAAVQPGNSGGPLLELSGAVIGVVSSKLDAVAVAAKTGDIPQSVNFAVKQTVARSFMESHGVEYQSSPSDSKEKTVTEVAGLAKKAVFPLDCLK
jgi:serine protease Do